MALTQMILAPTGTPSTNAVEFTIPMGYNGIVSLYTAAGGGMDMLPPTVITLKNPSGTFQDTDYMLGNGAGGTKSVILPNGVYSFKKPVTTNPIGIQLSTTDVVGP